VCLQEQAKKGADATIACSLEIVLVRLVIACSKYVGVDRLYRPGAADGFRHR
jgi:hypothetical protein